MKLLLLLLTAVSVSFAQAKKPMKPAPKAAPAQQQQAPMHTAPAHAAHKSGAYSRPYGMAGCGLGSVVMDKRSSQVLVATTNGTSGNQTFAITTGTLNCLDDASSQVADKMDKYIQINKTQLAGDAAKGNGETIVALSEVMGCQSSQNLGSALKANYRDVFTNDTTNEVTDSIITVIQKDSQLSQECSFAQI